jgi:hypothetical protein
LAALGRYYLPHHLRAKAVGRFHATAKYQLLLVRGESKQVRMGLQQDVQEGSARLGDGEVCLSQTFSPQTLLWISISSAALSLAMQISRCFSTYGTGSMMTKS